MRKYPRRQNLDDLDLQHIELPEELDEVAIKNLYTKWGLSPLDWARYFFPSYFQKKSPEFHYEISRNWLYQPHKIQAYEAPRGSAKTTLSEFMGLHSAIFDQRGFILFISLTEDIAALRLNDLRHECEHNKLFRLFFGDMVSEKWGEKEFILNNERSGIHCKFLARGLGQQVLGLKYLEKRPQLVILDDPEDIKVAENPDNVDKDERWFIKEVEPCLSDDGKIVVIGTPVTADCLIERLRKRRNIYFKRYGAITKDGVALWPEYKTLAQLRELRDDLSAAGQLYIYYSEYLCNPQSPDRHPISEDMIEFYSRQDLDLTGGNHNVFFLVDLAIGEKKHNAFSALVVIAVDESDTWYIVDTYQTRSDWYEFSKDLYGYRDLYNPLDIGVELAATQAGFWDVLKLTADKHGWKPMYPLAVKPDKDKDIRLRRLLPRFRTRKIKFLAHQTELKQQLLLHPDYKHQDLKDCLAYGHDLCYPPGATKPQQNKVENWRLGRTDSDDEMDDEYTKYKANLEKDDWSLEGEID